MLCKFQSVNSCAYWDELNFCLWERHLSWVWCTTWTVLELNNGNSTCAAGRAVLAYQQ